ncbi:MAG: MOSC domain-containing protein [Cyanothece sp. SIO1E1]|nr:MOSC domain-containing protein [Cyanothece sp. SIO1E1]
MSTPYLTRIAIYPIKSLDGMTLERTPMLNSGALGHDREFALLDEQGRFVNGKRNAKVHQLRTSISTDYKTLSIQIQGSEQRTTFQIDDERPDLEAWFSDYFGFAVKLAQNTVMGFPDDTHSPGPTIISTATLETVASWFPGLSPDDIRLRLRTNLEIDGVPPFWEDRLFAQPHQQVQFQIGEVLFEGINPCQRCVVPTRDAKSGEGYPNFQKIFVAQRKALLPDWATSTRFNHFYRLAINTRLPGSQTGRTLSVGDEVTIQQTVEG